MLQTIKENLVKYGPRNAFCIKDKTYTYADLHEAIAKITYQIGLAENQITNKRIAILATDDFETYASLFAIWFCGYAYVPLGLHNPVERNLTIMREAGISTLISKFDLNDSAYDNIHIIKPDLSANNKHEIAVPKIVESDLAYILFTSGSTGLPKGVPISHKNLAAFIKAFDSSPFQIDESDKCLQMFELTFDVSISSYLIPILKGACVYTVPNTVVKNVYVLKLLKQYGLTSIQIVPSIIKLSLPLLSKVNFPEVKNCILTGEATNIDLLPVWQQSIPNAAIYNFYGPTEATIYCSYYKYDPTKQKSYNGMLAIGEPMKGMELVVVNEKDQPVGKNEKGEMLISGDQLTEGYLNNAGKNKLSFIKCEHISPGKIFYRSGDLCFFDDDGVLIYCGRLDNQVKIQGFRVELGEIEMLVRTEFTINNVVTTRSTKGDAIELVLVLENVDDSMFPGIVNYLQKKLPEYMIPAQVVSIEVFPLTSSGKTDRTIIKSLINEKV